MNSEPSNAFGRLYICHFIERIPVNLKRALSKHEERTEFGVCANDKPWICCHNPNVQQ